MTCPQLVDSGVYVLGALSPAQRVAFERHMATCAECQAEVNDLAVLPGLLGRLDEPTVVATAEICRRRRSSPACVRRVRRQRRGRRVARARGRRSRSPAWRSSPGWRCRSSAVRRRRRSRRWRCTPMQAVADAEDRSRSPRRSAFTPVSGGGGTQIEVKCQYGPGRPARRTPARTSSCCSSIPRNGAPARAGRARGRPARARRIQRTGDTAWQSRQDGPGRAARAPTASRCSSTTSPDPSRGRRSPRAR